MAPAQCVLERLPQALARLVSDRPLHRDIGDRASIVSPDQQEDRQPPAPSPVNASRLPSRTTRASLGASAVRYSFTVTDFHRLPLAGLPANPSTHVP
jgi:hypothetical protein